MAVVGPLGDVDGVEQGLVLVGFEGFTDGLGPFDEKESGLVTGGASG